MHLAGAAFAHGLCHRRNARWFARVFGFVAELQVLVGAWMVRPWWTIAAGIGIVIGVAYTWRALQKAFFSDCSHRTRP